MARKRRAAKSKRIKTTDYRHTGEKRPNIPPAKIAAEGRVPNVPKARYYYNPHLPPVLRYDPTGEADELKELVYEAAKRPLRPKEVKKVSEAIHHYDPWLEWAGKREQNEKGYFEVDPVVLHIHERVSAQAIVRAAMREDVQRDFFADPQQPYQEAIQFYKHDVDWANRLILGDSLQVMSSLARRENLAGKVQMIYVDPPYGINYRSNFQPFLGAKSVRDSDTDLSREPEMIRAYRDTWALGIHSYLSYLRSRFTLIREVLSDEGSVFVQIGEENQHLVRAALDEVFGRKQFVSQIAFRTSVPLGATYVPAIVDYLLWYSKTSTPKFRRLFTNRTLDPRSRYSLVELSTGARRRLSTREKTTGSIPKGARAFVAENLNSAGRTPSCVFPVEWADRRFEPTRNKSWKTNPEGMARLIRVERLYAPARNLSYVLYLDDYPVRELSNIWLDSQGASNKQYVVQTAPKIIERCMLMTTDAGDLVLDPTCGGGTTAWVAEKWGRRWITTDTSRVALAIARQRLLTARFESYSTASKNSNPASGFVYKPVPHVTLGQVAQNQNLDPILERHEPVLDGALDLCNTALAHVDKETRATLGSKLRANEKERGTRNITDADRRRWDLPNKFEHWTVPFDTDPDWPKALQDAVTAYRKAWRAKTDEVNQCIADNADQEELVDQPEVVNGVLRVSGPFTVEGVRPEELSLGEEGLFDPTPNEFEDGEAQVEVKNINAYLTLMVQHLRIDGLTFLGNKQRTFARLEPLFETQTGSIIHAEGLWENGQLDGPNPVAVGFGPQYGPVTALQVEELIRAAKRYDELVVAGFSFDAEATEVIQAQSHPKLQIHQAYIRPDINPAMEGLLKDTANSQLFTVFGQPEVEVEPTKGGECVVKLKGVDIYDPIENTVRSSGADKVAAWFLDSDYDGRCFCITQAFFPDQDAWKKIAKALGSSADEEAFEKFDGTESLPFKAGKYKRIAVKVIDPRGNEVMAVRQLED